MRASLTGVHQQQTARKIWAHCALFVYALSYCLPSLLLNGSTKPMPGWAATYYAFYFGIPFFQSHGRYGGIGYFIAMVTNVLGISTFLIFLSRAWTRVRIPRYREIALLAWLTSTCALVTIATGSLWAAARVGCYAWTISPILLGIICWNFPEPRAFKGFEVLPLQ